MPEISYMPVFMQRDIVQVPEKFTKPLVHLESFLHMAQHLKVAMYVSALFLLGLLSGVYYQRTVGDPVGPSSVHSHDANQRRSISAGWQNRSSRSNGTGKEGESDYADKFIVPVDIGNLSPPIEEQLSNRKEQALANWAPNQGNLASEAKSTTANQSWVFSKAQEQRMLADKSVHRAKNSKPTRDTNNSDRLNSTDNSQRVETSGSVEIEADYNRAENGEAEPQKIGDLEARPSEIEASSYQRSARSRNWFVRVYTDVVRVLNDIKKSITIASQLDIQENDFHDKQLEMLAGKIDNWYGDGSGAADTANTTITGAPTSQARKDDELNRDAIEASTSEQAITSNSTTSNGNGNSKQNVPKDKPTQIDQLNANEAGSTTRWLEQEQGLRVGVRNSINMSDNETQTDYEFDLLSSVNRDTSQESEREFSIKSNQRRIDKSETSFDESVSGLQGSGLVTEDKAAALEQLEQSISILEAGEEQQPVKQETETKHGQQTEANRAASSTEQTSECNDEQGQHLMIGTRVSKASESVNNELSQHDQSDPDANDQRPSQAKTASPKSPSLRRSVSPKPGDVNEIDELEPTKTETDDEIQAAKGAADGPSGTQTEHQNNNLTTVRGAKKVGSDLVDSEARRSARETNTAIRASKIANRIDDKPAQIAQTAAGHQSLSNKGSGSRLKLDTRNEISDISGK